MSRRTKMMAESFCSANTIRMVILTEVRGRISTSHRSKPTTTRITSQSTPRKTCSRWRGRQTTCSIGTASCTMILISRRRSTSLTQTLQTALAAAGSSRKVSHIFKGKLFNSIQNLKGQRNVLKLCSGGPGDPTILPIPTIPAAADPRTNP